MAQEIEDRIQNAGLSLASLQKRTIAFIVDELLLAFIFLFIIYDQIAGVQDQEALVTMINGFTFEYLILKVIYQTLFVYQYSATLGKILMKIQIVDAFTFEKPTFSSALNRSIFRVISEMLFYFGFIWAFYSKNRQGWHDKTAQTIVVDA